MGVMEVIKKGFGTASKSLGLILILIVFNLIFNLASIPLAMTSGTAATPQVSALALILSLVFILVSIFLQGASLGLIRDLLKAGKLELGKFAGYGLKYYLRLLGLGLLIVLIIAIIAIVAALLIAATIPLKNTVVTVIMSIIALVIGAIGLYWIFLLLLTPYAIICDEIGIIEAMKKSTRTVRRSIGKVLLILAMLILISLGIGFLFGFGTGLLSAALPVRVGQILIGVVNSIVNGYLGVVMMVSFMVFYLGLVAKEKTSAEKVF